MPSNEFLLKDAQGLELEIERHCAGFGLDCSNEGQVHLFVHEMLQNMERLKEEAISGDRTARAKTELFSMVMMLHIANSKVYGRDYMTHIKTLAEREPAWVALAKVMWSELESRNPDNQ
ncbi:MAG: hypothetical protein WAW02_08325 [Sideroxyarcus sp.]